MKTINTEKALQAYRMLNTAKYSALTNEDKIKIFRITRALKPIAEAYEDACKDAVDRMKFDNFNEELSKAREYEQEQKAGTETKSLTDEEYRAIIEKLINYNNLVTGAKKELGSKEETIDVPLMSEDSFATLMSANDWTIEQAILVSDVVCE